MDESTLTLETIRQASSGELENFSLNFPGRERLVCQQIFRHLPGRRLVFKGRWGEAEVLVKLFFKKKDYLREKHGLTLLAQHGIPSPAQVWSFEDSEAFFVATEFFKDAQSLLSRCHAGVDEQGIRQTLEVLGNMHRVGLVQRDIHLDNFLFSEGEVYVIDGGSVNACKLSNKRVFTSNLALFFAQLPPLFDEKIESVLPCYDPAAPQLSSLLSSVMHWRLWRIGKYQKKSLRSCTEFLAEQNWNRYLLMRRDKSSKVLRKLLTEPDAGLGGTKLLKNGATASVFEVAGQEGESWVLKRYNIKSWKHWLSRCWRPSRAVMSWKSAQALALVSVSTAKPLALRESRTGRLRHEAYLITEKVAGERLDQWLLKRPGHEIPPWLDECILNTFKSLLGSRISHGDMKSTNFFVSDTDFVLIDLDATQVHRSERLFKRAFRKDMTRFMANWHGGTHRHFARLLSPIFKQIELDAPPLRI